MAAPAIIALGSIIGVPVARAVASRISSAITGSKGAQVLTDQEVIRIQGGKTLTEGGMFPPGADMRIEGQGLPPGTKFEVDAATGEIRILKRRRRRKRLLTCGDKADLAFITGTLGKGQLAQGAITSLLSKCG